MFIHVYVITISWLKIGNYIACRKTYMLNSDWNSTLIMARIWIPGNEEGGEGEGDGGVGGEWGGVGGGGGDGGVGVEWGGGGGGVSWEGGGDIWGFLEISLDQLPPHDNRHWLPGFSLLQYPQCFYLRSWIVWQRYHHNWPLPSLPILCQHLARLVHYIFLMNWLIPQLLTKKYFMLKKV